MPSRIKSAIAPLYRQLRWCAWWLAGLVPTLRVEPGHGPLVRLGTGYGGWWFVDEPGLQGAVIVSCGLGEDGSFDVEFAARYGATVLMVDPTPRAISHFAGILSRLGRSAEEGYTSSGAQSLRAYNLSRIRPGQLQL